MAKKKAVSYVVPDTTEATDQMIYELGTAMRAKEALELELKSKLADVTVGYASKLQELSKTIDDAFKGIQTYCEANRTTLLPGDSKTARFANGEVQWTLRPPSVEFKKGLKVEDVVQILKNKADELGDGQGQEAWKQSLALLSLIRKKEEVNKEAVLERPELVADIDALYIRKDLEDFSVKPLDPKIEVPNGI